MAFLALSRVAFNDPPLAPLRGEYISDMSVWRVIGRKGYIFLANPGGRTSKFAHVVDGDRECFRKTRK